MSLAARWTAFWCTPLSAEPLGKFRILYACIVLLHWLPRWPYIPELFSREGWQAPYLFYTWGHQLPAPAPEIAALIYGLLLVTAVGVLVGWKTRWSLILLVSCYLYLALIESINFKAYDRVMILEGMLLCWIPAGNTWSLDALWARRKGTPLSRTCLSYAPHLFLTLFCAIYFFSGLKKAFFTPHWWDGGVLLYAMLDLRNGLMPLGVWLTRYPGLVTMLAWGTTLWQFTFPLGVLWRRTTAWWLLAGVVIHGGIQATINVGPFNFIMVATYVLFLSRCSSSISPSIIGNYLNRHGQDS